MGLLGRLLGRTDDPTALRADLREAHAAELGAALALRTHAAQARYPQLAARLEALADVEARHAGWIAEELRRLGDAPSDVEPPLVTGRSPWERACEARRTAQRKRRRLRELLTRWDPDEAAAATVLRRIEREDAAGLAVLEEVVVRSDPHARD
ncbi:MAG: hypothetical protein KIT14_17690 [bacterium]|nr:hypothetical protein [bacterium]